LVLYLEMFKRKQTAYSIQIATYLGIQLV